MPTLREAAQAVYDEFVHDVNEKDAPIIFGKLTALGHVLRTTIEVDIFPAAWRKAEAMLRAQHHLMSVVRAFREGYAVGYRVGADPSATFDDDAAVQRWTAQRTKLEPDADRAATARGDACDILSALGVFSPARVDKLSALLLERERRVPGALIEASQQAYLSFLHAETLGALSGAMMQLRTAIEQHFAGGRP